MDIIWKMANEIKPMTQEELDAMTKEIDELLKQLDELTPKEEKRGS